MSRTLAQRSRGLVYLGFLLAILANLGLTVHADHHSPVLPYAAVGMQSLAEHNDPDPTLHLESVTEVRTLSCPGCLLQQQIGGSYLPTPWSQDRPTLVGVRGESALPGHATRTSTAQLTRGPPSC